MHPLMVEKLKLLERLDQIEYLSKSSKITRLWRDPFRYLYATGYAHFIYPITKRGQLVNINTFFGAKMNAFLPAGTDIFLLGAKSHDSEIRLTRFLINHLKKGAIFFDVGSHYGFFALLASKLLEDEGKVIAFEASQNNFQLLQTNCQTKSNIQLLHCAVTDKDETITFYEFPLAYSENNTLDTSVFNKESWYKKQRPTTVEVEGKTIASICQAIGLYPSLMKVDVEGAELQVINGMLPLFEQGIYPTVVMEFWTDSSKNQGQLQAIEILKRNQYQPFSIDSKGQPKTIDHFYNYCENLDLESDNLVFQR